MQRESLGGYQNIGKTYDIMITEDYVALGKVKFKRIKIFQSFSNNEILRF